MAEIALKRSQRDISRRRALAIAALAGAGAALGQAPASFPPATLLGLVVLLWLLSGAAGARRAAWIGWAAGTAYFALSLHWVVEPFLVDVARHGWMAPFALVGLSAGLALFWALAFGLARMLGRGRWSLALAWVVTLSAAELARSYVLTGFPWALIGHVWVGWAPMQLAAWVGPVGLTLLTLLCPAVVLAAWQRRPVRALVALVPFAGLYGFGAWQAQLPEPDAGVRPVLRLIQPNAAQHLKWTQEMAPIFFERQLQMTAATGRTVPDLVIWSETAIPYLLHTAGPALQQIASAAQGRPVILGIQRIDAFRAYNSLIVLAPDAEVVALYDKHHLVPFGEYIPAAWLLGRIGLQAFTAQQGYGFSPGPGARLLDLGPLGQALPLICYEAIFPQDVAAAPARPDWLLQITNDAWFGRIAGPYQHLAQARLRAVEQGLPLVRVANTGVSAVIDARGRVQAEIPLNHAGFLDAALPPPLPPTLYSRTGDAPLAGLLFLAGLGLSARRLRKAH